MSEKLNYLDGSNSISQGNTKVSFEMPNSLVKVGIGNVEQEATPVSASAYQVDHEASFKDDNLCFGPAAPALTVLCLGFAMMHKFRHNRRSKI